MPYCSAALLATVSQIDAVSLAVAGHEKAMTEDLHNESHKMISLAEAHSCALTWQIKQRILLKCKDFRELEHFRMFRREDRK
jgi:hypothetical protein